MHQHARLHMISVCCLRQRCVFAGTCGTKFARVESTSCYPCPLSRRCCCVQTLSSGAFFFSDFVWGKPAATPLSCRCHCHRHSASNHQPSLWKARTTIHGNALTRLAAVAGSGMHFMAGCGRGQKTSIHLMRHWRGKTSIPTRKTN